MFKLWKLGGLYMQMLRKKKAEQVDDGAQALLEALFEAKRDLDCARQKFDYATEPELVASCIYEMHAGQARYDHLLGLVRERGITAGRR